MQAWKQAAARYLPLPNIDEDEETGLYSHDSGSSRTLAESPDNYDDLGSPISNNTREYPPSLKQQDNHLQPRSTGLPRPSRVAYIIVLLSGTIIVLTLLLVASVSGSLVTSSEPTRPSSVVAEITQELTTEDIANNVTVNEAVGRLRNDGWMPIDSTRSSPFVSSKRPLVALASQKQTTYACAEQWIAKGELCQPIKSKKGVLKDSEIDVVWTWVTANDHWTGWRERLSKGLERLRARYVEIQRDRASEAKKNAKDKHFRSHHQLRYSQRSVVKNLPWVRKLHLLANDLPACDPSDVLCSNTHEDRVGQIPEWLDETTLTKSGSKFSLQHHWDLFKAEDDDAGAWRARSLPTFDSLAIESQLPNLRGAAENFLYMNDDLYIIRSMSPADFASPLFGQVIRIQKDLTVGGEAPGTSKQKGDGEWPGMTYSAWLLDRRFGIRQRSYLVHQGKMLNQPLLDEVASIWSDELKATAEVRFRGSQPEVNMLFLSTYYVIEKHREALLWSYFIARMDSRRQGQYSAEDRASISKDLGMNVQDGQILVGRPGRQSYEGQPSHDIHISAHLYPAQRTPYQFSSMNGYAFMPLAQPSSTWPDLDGTTVSPEKPWQVCNISVAVCFGSEDYFKPNFIGDVTSQTLFKRMAFDRPECGDCAIAAILSHSHKGLEPFLPAAHGKSASSPFDPKHATTPPPQLGSWEKSWEETNFGISDVLGDSAWNVREYAVRLLQRYSYVIGGTPTRFIGLRRPLETVKVLKELTDSMEDPNGPAFIALNDDILKTTYVAVVDANLAKWHENMWPNATSFELVKHNQQ